MLEKNLRATWARLQPVCADLLEEAGELQQQQQPAVRRQPAFSDFIWAYTIFWWEQDPPNVSCGLGCWDASALSVPGYAFAAGLTQYAFWSLERHAQPPYEMAGTGCPAAMATRGLAGRSRAQSFPAAARSRGDGARGLGDTVPQEGIVPGLDFCNHDSIAQCRWTIWGAPAEQQRGVSQVRSL